VNSATGQGSKKFQWLRWGGTAISILLFIWLVSRQDWHEMWRYLQQLPFWLLPLALLFYLAGMVANAVRWYILLQAPKIRVSFWTTVKIVFTGAYVSNFLPSTIGGDTVRFVGVMHLTSNRAVGLASVILDRLINLSAFMTVLPLSVLTFGSPATWLGSALPAGASLPIAAMASSGPGPATSLLRRVKRWIQRGREAFGIWLQRPSILILAFCVSWLSIFVVFIAIWLVARGLGIPVALYQVMGITGITYLLTLLPISVNGYGLREVAITTLYLPLGASLEQAATLALITRFLSMLETLPGALWLSQVVSGQVGQVQADQEQTNQDQVDQVQTDQERADQGKEV
jgi:glycosyltransferase 2 family protein